MGRRGVPREQAQNSASPLESGLGKRVENPLGSPGSGLEEKFYGVWTEEERKPRYTHCLGPASIRAPQAPEKVS